MITALPAPPTVAARLTLTAADLAHGLAAVLPHAATVRDAPALAGVWFETDRHGLWLVATDRYSLAATTVPVTETTQPARVATVPAGCGLVPVKDVKRLTRLLTDTHDGDQDVTLMVTDTAVTAATGGGQVTVPLVPRYPSWRTLLADRLADLRPPAATHGYNPLLLARFTTAVTRGQPITIRYGAAERPALILANRFAGLLMPYQHHQPPDTDWLTPAEDTSTTTDSSTATAA